MDKFNLRPHLKSLLLIFSLLLLGACAPVVTNPSATPAQPTATRTALPLPTETSAQTQVSPTLSACPPMDSAIRATMRQIEDQVVRLRGLQPTGAVDRDLLTTAQLRSRVEEDFLGDYTAEEARRDALLLSQLGLIEPGQDLHALYIDLLTEQVAGFYDSLDEEMLVVCGTGFGGLEIFTYAHEYVHALQDQTFDLETGMNFSEEACELDGERCLALRALIEGDASLLQEQWLRTYADPQTLEALLSSLGDLDSPVFASAPEYIQAELTFPYLSGLAFVRTLYLDGGWAAVDSAYQNPPLSSEQILHPDRYPRDLPVRLSPPTTSSDLTAGWEVVHQDALGEWAILQTLLAYLPEEAAQEAAAGWGGDLVFLLENALDGDAAIVMIAQWDTMRDAHEFSSGMIEYGQERFGEPAHRDTAEATWVFDGGTSHFLRQSNQTRWIVAPDGETLSMLQSTFALPLLPAQ